MVTELTLNTPLAPPLPLRRFSVAQYHQLGELGILTPEDKVELLEGWIVEKMNQRPVHGFLVGLLNECFQRQLSSGFAVRCQLPMTSERSEPEPDLAIVRGGHADFRHQHPRGSDCVLVIEVGDTSLEKDRAKISIYRSSGVPEYWIVNVAEKCVERYAFSPGRDDAKPQLYRAGERITFEIERQQLTVEVQSLFT